MGLGLRMVIYKVLPRGLQPLTLQLQARLTFILQLKLDWGLRLLQEGMPLPWQDIALSRFTPGFDLNEESSFGLRLY